MSVIIDFFRNLLFPSTLKSVVTLDKLQGAFVGSGVGESLGLPVINRTEEDLRRNPVTDFLGFGDIKAPAGANSLCVESLADFAKYLADNFSGGYTAERFFTLCNNWYIIKVKDEEQRLRIMIPCACLAGVYYSFINPRPKKALETLSDIFCDEAVAPSAYVFYASYFISTGLTPKNALKKSETETMQMLKKIGLKVSENSFTKKLSEILTGCYSKGCDYKKDVLYCINKGVYPDLAGNISGFLSGLFCGLENIPYIWSGFLRQKAALEDSALATWRLCGNSTQAQGVKKQYKNKIQYTS